MVGGEWPLLLRQLNDREQAWNRRVVYSRPDAVPFLPYPLPRFAMFLQEAMAALPSWACYDPFGLPKQPRMLDVGCGPGTKLQLARALYGLDCTGIDLVPEYVAETRQAGIEAHVADAFNYGYSAYSLVLVNRPSSRQDELEALICERMAPGAVLIALNWRNDPAKLARFDCVSQEWGEPVHGVWAKPQGVVHRAGTNPVASPTACCGRPLGDLPEADSLTVDAEDVTCRTTDDGGFETQTAAAPQAGELPPPEAPW